MANAAPHLRLSPQPQPQCNQASLLDPLTGKVLRYRAQVRHLIVTYKHRHFLPVRGHRELGYFGMPVRIRLYAQPDFERKLIGGQAISQLTIITL